MRVEMNPNVVLPTLLDVKDDVWSFTVAVSIFRAEEESSHERDESIRSKGKFDSKGRGVVFGKFK